MPKVFLNKAPLKASEEDPDKEYPAYTVNVGIIKVSFTRALEPAKDDDDDALRRNRVKTQLVKMYWTERSTCINHL